MFVYSLREAAEDRKQRLSGGRDEGPAAGSGRDAGEMLSSLVVLLQDQALRLAEQSAEIRLLRTEADRCGARRRNSENAAFCELPQVTPAPLAAKSDSDGRFSSAAEFLEMQRARLKKLSLEEEALQKEMQMAVTS